MHAKNSLQISHSFSEATISGNDGHTYESYFATIQSSGIVAVAGLIDNIKKYQKYIKSIAEVEDKRVKSLNKLVPALSKDSIKNAADSISNDAYSNRRFLDIALKTMVADSGKYEEDLKNLENHVLIVKELIETLDAQRKNCEAKIEKVRNQLCVLLGNLDTKRRNFHKKVHEHGNAARIYNDLNDDINATKKSVADAKQHEIEKTKCMDDARLQYIQAIENFNKLQVDEINIQATGVLKELHESYQSIIMKFKDEVIRFFKQRQVHLDTLIGSCKEIENIALGVNPEGDLKQLIKDTKSSTLKLPNQILIEYYATFPKSQSDNGSKTSSPVDGHSMKNQSSTESISISSISSDISRSPEPKVLKSRILKGIFGIRKTAKGLVSSGDHSNDDNSSKSVKKRSNVQSKVDRTVSAKNTNNPFDTLQFSETDDAAKLLEILMVLDKYMIAKQKEIRILDDMKDKNEHKNMSNASLNHIKAMRQNFTKYQEVFNEVYNLHSSKSSEPYEVKYTSEGTEFHFSDEEDRTYDAVSCELEHNSTSSSLTKTSCIALYDFTGIDEDDLSIVAEEKLHYLEAFDESWSRVERTDGSGESGLVPTTYIKVE